MALHRDIYWVGKQWAVTGHGIQACNQKQRGQFDIESSRLWEEGVQESVRSLAWVNAEDFDRAVDAARSHYPEPSQTAAPPVSAPPVETVPAPEAQAERSATPKFYMRLEGVSAKLRPVWRIRRRAEGSSNGQ